MPPEPRSQRSSDARTLVFEASRGDPDAIETLLADHLPGLRAWLRMHAGRLLRAKESVSDLAQSICREVLEGMDRDRPPDETAFKQWLYRKAMYKIVDRARYYRAARRDAAREASLHGEASMDSGSPDCLVSSCTPSRVAIGRETIAGVERAFDRLPEDYRNVVLLSRIAGLSHAEIAKRMGRSVGAVSTLLYRALARLSLLLEDGGAESRGSSRRR